MHHHWLCILQPITQFFPLNNQIEQFNIKILIAQQSLFFFHTYVICVIIDALYGHAFPHTLTVKRETSEGVCKNKHCVYPDRSYIIGSTLYGRQNDCTNTMISVHWQTRHVCGNTPSLAESAADNSLQQEVKSKHVCCRLLRGLNMLSFGYPQSIWVFCYLFAFFSWISESCSTGVQAQKKKLVKMGRRLLQVGRIAIHISFPSDCISPSSQRRGRTSHDHAAWK